jgi:hypothetical protein
MTSEVFELALLIRPEICRGAIDEGIVLASKRESPKINNATCRRVSLKNRALIIGQRCVFKPFCELNIYKHESWWFSEKS